MIGIILLAITWLLLRIEGRTLSAIGFNHPLKRTQEFFAGFCIAALFAVAQFTLASEVADFSWKINPNFGLNELANSLRWVFNSVIYEELIFRGYLLYKLIQWLGSKTGVALSSISFGIYHWFSYGIFGHWMSMIFVFIMTASFGLMLAYAFYKTRSIILPIALHLSWNIVTLTVFSNGSIGDQWLYSIPEGGIQLLSGYAALWINLVLPLCLPLLVLFVLKKMKFRGGE
ncbi:MAG: CPBP family intramembrane metalloprotease [Kangiella sp.]|nr:CPBP family intramembrane metalloprotease [Kangiella sp.]